MDYRNQDHQIPNWWILAALIITFILGIIVGVSRTQAQSSAVMKGYIDGVYKTYTTTADYNLSEDGRSLDVMIGADTICFDVMVEKMTILNDSVIRTEYQLNKNSVFIIEPAYESGNYIGDYCKMIIRKADPFDKIVILFWADPTWVYDETIAGYQ